MVLSVLQAKSPTGLIYILFFFSLMRLLIVISTFSYRKIDFKFFFRIIPEENKKVVAQMNLTSNLLCARELLEEEVAYFSSYLVSIVLHLLMSF